MDGHFVYMYIIVSLLACSNFVIAIVAMIFYTQLSRPKKRRLSPSIQKNAVAAEVYAEQNNETDMHDCNSCFL